jgi:sortase A
VGGGDDVNAIRTAIHGTGELLITLGLVVLLFCAYQLLWTNFEANAAASGVSSDLRGDWDVNAPAPQASEPAPVPSASPTKPPIGDGFAFMYIPKLGSTWVRPVVEGVSKADLAKGVGHYPETALPGEVGNFAVAGHRATNGEPFRNLDLLEAGDAIVVETADRWFTYRVTDSEIVKPTDVEVILPVPNKPGATPVDALITLTTCHPRWASTERMIVYGQLESERLKEAGPPEALAGSPVVT